MTRRYVIERWVQRKTDQKLIFNGNYTQIVFFCFQDTLSLCFILFIWFIWSKNMCKHTLTHIIAKKCNFCLKKQRKTLILAIFGDFRVFNMTSLMTSLWRHTRYVFTFFGTNGLGKVIAIHQYHTLDVSSIGFRDLGRAESAPPPTAVGWVQKARLFQQTTGQQPKTCTPRGIFGDHFFWKAYPQAS